MGRGNWPGKRVNADVNPEEQEEEVVVWKGANISRLQIQIASAPPWLIVCSPADAAAYLLWYFSFFFFFGFL